MGCCASADDENQKEKKEPLILSSVNVDNSLTSLTQNDRKSAEELLLSWNLKHHYDILVAKDYLPIEKWQYLDQNTLMHELNFPPDDATNFMAEVAMYFEQRKKDSDTKKMQEEVRKLNEQYDIKDDSLDTEQLRHHEHDDHEHDPNLITNEDSKNKSRTYSMQQEDPENSDDENPTHNHNHTREHSQSHDDDDDTNIDFTPGDDLANQTSDNVVLEDTSDLQNMKDYMTHLRKTSNLDGDIEAPLMEELNNNVQIEKFEEDVPDEELHEHVETKDIDLDESEDLATDDDDM